MRRLIHILTLFILILSSCERRPLVDLGHRTNINVRVNIDAISNVTCDIYNDKIAIPEIKPIAMHVLFFDEDTKEVAAESFISDISYDEDGTRVISGNISIMPGDYKVLVYDFGTESTIVEDYYKWDDCLAYTNEISPAIKRSLISKVNNKALEEAHVIYEPDHLVVAAKEHEYIPYHHDVHTVEAEALSVVESYYLQIKVVGLEYVSSAQAILSGMVNGNMISSNTKIVEPQATIWFDMEKSDDKGEPVICTIFNTFGRIEDSENELEVTFDLKTHDGRTIQKSFDLSELFLSPDCVNHHWLLLEETITIEPPQVEGGGFAPEVNDWEEEHRDLYI